MDREYVEAIKRLFAEHGVRDFYFEHGGRHPRVIARFRGKLVQSSFPCTGSDFRGIRNCIGQLRKELALRPGPKSVASRPRHQCPVKQQRSFLGAEMAPIDKPDWRDALAQLRTHMTNDAVIRDPACHALGAGVEA